MSTVEAPPMMAAADLSELTPLRIDAATFGRMLDAEVFPDETRVELWDGRIYEKMAKNRPHYLAGNKVNFILSRVVPQGWVVGNENPVQLHQVRTPLPDLVLLCGGFDDYIDRDPVAADVGLIVELADSSLRFDTTTKLAGYAEANIPAYWVVNLVKNVIQVYEVPLPGEKRYQLMQTYAVGQAVPLRLDGVLIAEIPAIDLLPVRA